LPGQDRARARYDDLTFRATEFRSGLVAWFMFYTAVSRAKLMIVDKLDEPWTMSFHRPDLYPFLAEEFGATMRTGHEGYVVRQGHRMVKLVNRQTFSRLNFAANENR
jgi:hypothetical protein